MLRGVVMCDAKDDPRIHTKPHEPQSVPLPFYCSMVPGVYEQALLTTQTLTQFPICVKVAPSHDFYF